MSARAALWAGPDLGDTRDASALIRGDADALRGDAYNLDAMVQSLAMVADGLGGLDVGGWTGDAATVFVRAGGELREKVLVAATSLSTAATALHVHATTLEWAQGRARTAIRLYDSVEMCMAPGMLGDVGLTPGQQRAVAMLVEARAEVKASAAAASAAIEDATVDAPVAPGFWNHAGYYWSELCGGATEAFTGLGELVWQVSTIHQLVDPEGWYTENKELLGGLFEAVKHPGELGKSMIDYDTWTTSPARALGHLAPDALIALLTAGGGAVATRGATAGERVAVDAARAAEASGEAAVAANTARSVLRTPQVSSTRLQNLVDNLYKGTSNPNRVGNGTTMDAIRSEAATGVTTGGRMHTVKGQETLQGLNNWLRRNPDASYQDRLVAQSLADELAQVLGGS